MPETSCKFYVTEDLELDIVHCTNEGFGFCYLQGFMVPCEGKCSCYDKYEKEEVSV